MTVAGLLYAFVGAGILCRVFFHLAANGGELLQGSASKNAPPNREHMADHFMDAALALPLMVAGFAMQALGQVTAGGLNWLGVVLALALAFAMLLYGLMKSEVMEALLAKRTPSRELPAPAVLLPTPEPQPEVLAVEELRPAVEIKTPTPSKPQRQARNVG